MEGVVSSFLAPYYTIFLSPKILTQRLRCTFLSHHQLSSSRSSTSPFSFGTIPSTPSAPSTSLFATPEVGVSTETGEWEMQGFYTLRKDVEITSQRVQDVRASAGLQQLEADLAELERAAADSSLWDDRTKAQETLVALTDVKDKLKLLNEFQSQVKILTVT